MMDFFAIRCSFKTCIVIAAFAFFVSALNAAAQTTPGFLAFIGDSTQPIGTNVTKIVLQPDGKILISGNFTTVGGVGRPSFARLDSNGNLDTTFSPNLVSSLVGFALQADGRIVVVTNDGSNLRGNRLNSDGSQDTSFAQFILSNLPTSAAVNDLQIGPDNKLYIAGDFETINGITRRDLVRVNSDGTVDTAFPDIATIPLPAGGRAVIGAFVFQSDGKILVAGIFGGIAGASANDSARLNSDGTLDTSFVGLGVPDQNYIRKMYLLPDGEIIQIVDVNILQNIGTPRKLNSDGTLDNVFIPHNNNLGECSLQDELSLLCGIPYPGSSNLVKIDTVTGVATSFNILGLANGGGMAIAIQPDAKILVGGRFYPIDNGIYGVSDGIISKLIRVRPDRSIDRPKIARVDYDGDFKSDVSVFRPSNGTWYMLKSTQGFSRQSWGVAGDEPVPADFDGDGKTDTAIYRASDATWYILKSTDSTYYSIQWGESTDTPLAGDYNGDRKADYMIYRPSTATWFLKSSLDFSMQSRIFGDPGDLPLLGDFDGDYRNDYAVFRASANQWRLHSSLKGTVLLQNWGALGDIPLPADYRGNGKTQIGLFRPSTNAWWIDKGAVPTQTWGQTGDEPTPADYDGDGKSDFAIFRPSTNMWYIAGTTGAFITYTFGEAGDIPLH